MPASVNKLYTSAAALLRYGADGTLTTTVLSQTLPDEAGTITGNVVLRGGGDPTFGTAAASQLAGRLAQAGLQRITGPGDRRRVGVRPASAACPRPASGSRARSGR